MSANPQFSLSVVSHGQGHLIRHFLEDLRTLSGATFEVIVTLNIPEDHSFLAPFRDLPVTVIENPTRKGFGANHNAAFKASRGQFFTVVNPDIRVPGLNLSSLCAQFDARHVAACAPCVLSAEGLLEDSARRYPTIGRLATRVILRRRVPDYDLVGDVAVTVDWVAGMFVAFRRSAFDDIGGFDERYFMYMEDAEICRRLRRRGYEVLVDPRTSVVHDAQRASRRNLRHLSWHLRSALRFLTEV
jgi:N-acetylglucosaminyl-diphospho-decaprenol L-rhamnosyltransferase